MAVQELHSKRISKLLEDAHNSSAPTTSVRSQARRERPRVRAMFAGGRAIPAPCFPQSQGAGRCRLADQHALDPCQLRCGRVVGGCPMDDSGWSREVGDGASIGPGRPASMYHPCEATACQVGGGEGEEPGKLDRERKVPGEQLHAATVSRDPRRFIVSCES